MVLINFMTDPSGANDYTATISVGGGQTGEGNGTPAQVDVKYLSSPSVSEKFNITWAGQTFGGRGQSDGRLLGNETVQTVECDQTANTCSVQVPAPGAALVFFTPTAAEESSPSSTQTFATTAVTRTVNTATVAPSVVATSNGHNAANRSKSRLGSTSYGSSSGTAGRAGLIPGMITLTAGFAGIAIVRRLFVS